MPRPRLTTCKRCGADRDPASAGAFCQDCARAYYREKNRESRRRHTPCRDPQMRRLDLYAAEAMKRGADEATAARVAVAADLEFVRGKRGKFWMSRFIDAELAYLRENAELIAHLDLWTPMPGREWRPVRETGWDMREAS